MEEPTAEIDAAAFVERLRAGAVRYVPIRHHSPACARAVAEVIGTTRPWAVLVEGPPSFDDVIELLVHDDARMPLAVYAHAVVDDEHVPGGRRRDGMYFPMCDYSPELVALREAARVGARATFIDLDHGERALMEPIGPAPALDDERVYAYSAALRRLADRLGCRDHNELWDHLIEAADLEADDVIAAVATYGRLARIGATEPDPLNAAREAAMAAGIRRTLAERDAAGSDQPLVVVTGAFHTVALPDLVEAAAPAERTSGSAAGGRGRGRAARARRPVHDVGHGLIRYSFDRLDALSGYGAGMVAPGWYQRTWEQQTSPATATADGPVGATLGNVARAIRARNGDGQPSTPALIDAHSQAQLLARLRGRDVVSRCDVLDAINSCFVKGDLAPEVADAVEREMTGSRVGRLPPGAPRSPLARDFDARAEALGLALDTTEPKRVELQLYRSARHREVSRFLHGVTALGVVFAVPEQQPQYATTIGRDVLREIWSCRFSAETDMTLTEAARFGASVREAVEAQLQGQFHELVAARAGSAELLRLVLAAAQRGVHHAIDDILDEVRRRVGDDADLSSVVAALTEAHLLWTARPPLDGRALDALPAITVQLFVRACRLLDDLPETPSDAVDARIRDLRGLHEVLQSASWMEVDGALLWDALATVTPAITSAPLRGAVDGVRWRGGRLADEELHRSVVGYLAAPLDASIGAGYLRGLLAIAREAVLHEPALLEALSAFLDGIDDDEFVRRLPGLRSAFAVFTPRETDQIAEELARQLGISAAVRVTDQSEADLLASLARSRLVAQRLAGDGLAGWLDPAPPDAGGQP